jgi:hypothetical protein
MYGYQCIGINKQPATLIEVAESLMFRLAEFSREAMEDWHQSSFETHFRRGILITLYMAAPNAELMTTMKYTEHLSSKREYPSCSYRSGRSSQDLLPPCLLQLHPILETSHLRQSLSRIEPQTEFTLTKRRPKSQSEPKESSASTKPGHSLASTWLTISNG